MANAQFTIHANPVPAGAPKEIGYLQRIEGVHDGLREIEGRLMTFVGRLTGEGNPTPAGEEPRASGLDATLSLAEQRVRSVLQTLDTLHDRF